MAASNAVDAKIVLPMALASPADVTRLRRGAGDLASYLQKLKLQQEKSGEASESLPRPHSGLLAEFASANDLNLSKINDCRKAETMLTELLTLAPVIHISFASEPSSGFLQKITDWFRVNVNPLTLITVGLQPSVAAGCYLRTTNRYFDLSLRRRLADKRELLINELSELAQNGRQ